MDSIKSDSYTLNLDDAKYNIRQADVVRNRDDFKIMSIGKNIQVAKELDVVPGIYYSVSYLCNLIHKELMGKYSVYFSDGVNTIKNKTDLYNYFAKKAISFAKKAEQLNAGKDKSEQIELRNSTLKNDLFIYIDDITLPPIMKELGMDLDDVEIVKKGENGELSSIEIVVSGKNLMRPDVHKYSEIQRQATNVEKPLNEKIQSHKTIDLAFEGSSAVLKNGSQGKTLKEETIVGAKIFDVPTKGEMKTKSQEDTFGPDIIGQEVFDLRIKERRRELLNATKMEAKRYQVDIDVERNIEEISNAIDDSVNEDSKQKESYQNVIRGYIGKIKKPATKFLIVIGIITIVIESYTFGKEVSAKDKIDPNDYAENTTEDIENDNKTINVSQSDLYSAIKLGKTYYVNSVPVYTASPMENSAGKTVAGLNEVNQFSLVTENGNIYPVELTENNTGITLLDYIEGTGINLENTKVRTHIKSIDPNIVDS